MMKEKNNKLFNESLEKFKYSVGYSINEYPRYKPLVGMDEVFDELPSSNSEDKFNKNKPTDKPGVENNDSLQQQPPVEEPQPETPSTPIPAFDSEDPNNDP